MKSSRDKPPSSLARDPVENTEAPVGPSLGEQLRALPSWRRRLGFLLGRHTSHWTRIVMDHETQGFLSGLEPSRLSTLEVSGIAWRDFGFGVYRSVGYPAFDLCAGPLEGAGPFDVVIAEQVLEHVLDPASAVRHARSMLRPGGWLLVTTPFLVRLHPQPYDMHRWTGTGMRILLRDAGFENAEITVKTWGNRRAVVANLDRWIRYKPLFHSLANEPRYPLVVWAFARRT